MSAQSNAVPESPLDTPATGATVASPTRPLYWSVRRELWENRSLYIAPLVAAAVVLLSFLVNIVHLPDGVRAMSELDPARQRALLTWSYGGASFLIVMTMAIVAWFYCLDALYSERRDRSILFWKSLPVSDFTTMLSKASIPFIVLPLLTFAIAAVTQLLILILNTGVVIASGMSAVALWTQLPLFQIWLVLLYGLVALTLWYAPIYGWLLLVSAWAKRSTFLWAVLPPAAICVVEGIAFRSSHFLAMLKYRFTGIFVQGFSGSAIVTGDGARVSVHGRMPEELTQVLDPVKLLSTPGLWIGLAFAAGCLAAVVWLRRDREPI